MPRPVPLSPERLEELATRFGTPYQLYDEAAIRENVQQLLRSFRAQFPSFRQFFAVKALPNPAILRILMEEGCGLDCSSTSELFVASKLGVRGGDIMYTSNYTSDADLRMAVEQGVIINLDDASLVPHLARVCRSIGKPFPRRLCFRLNPGLGRTDSETKSNVLGGPDAKFGVPADAIVDAYRAALEAGATDFGMHMMTGSCVLNEAYWRETVSVLLDTIGRVRAALGIDFEFVNIGGGLGIQYRPTATEDTSSATPSLDVLARSIFELMEAKTAEHGLPAIPDLCMENGRFVTGPFGWLVARCHVVKRAYGHKYCGLDACMSNLMRPGMYGAYHHISVPAHYASAVAAAGGPTELAPTNVVGTLCENNDWFAKDRPLPADCGVGDLFIIHDTGAHSHSMGFQYNGKLRAPELLLRPDGSVDLIRERETYADLFANTCMPKGLGASPDFGAASTARSTGATATAATSAVPVATPTLVSAASPVGADHTERIASSWAPGARPSSSSSSSSASTAASAVASKAEGSPRALLIALGALAIVGAAAWARSAWPRVQSAARS